MKNINPQRYKNGDDFILSIWVKIHNFMLVRSFI